MLPLSSSFNLTAACPAFFCPGGAGVEAQLALGAGLAEALAKLVLHNNSWVAYSAATGQLGGLEDEEVLKVGACCP